MKSHPARRDSGNDNSGERKLGDCGPGKEAGSTLIDGAHRQLVGVKINGERSEWHAEGAGVDHGDAPGAPPNRGTVGVAEQQEPRVRTVAADKLGGDAGLVPPRAQDAEGAQWRPNRVGSETKEIFQAVRLRLVALESRGSDPAPERKARIESVTLRRWELGEAGGDARRNERGVAAPRDDVVVEDVTVGQENAAVREVEGMAGRQIGVVVAGDEGDARHLGLKELERGCAVPGGLAIIRAGAGVERIAVEHEMPDPGEERPELREIAEAGRAITEMKVGEDAGEHAAESRLRNTRCRLTIRVRMKFQRNLIFSILLLVAAGMVRADQAVEIARLHLEAIGGAERMAALKSLRMTGQVAVGDKRMKFTMIAARPNRIRLETESGGRTLVHASDGVEAPWEFDTGTWPPQFRDMGEANAKSFTADAEFDDPLIAGKARGYALDYAGEVQVADRKLLRILVTKALREQFFLLLDPVTYFIVMRLEERQTTAGQKRAVATRYDDFRPVDGVLLPHRVTLITDNRVDQAMLIERIESNPAVKADLFTRPRATGAAEKK